MSVSRARKAEVNKRYRMLLRFQARLADWTGTNWAYNPVTGSLDHTAGVGDTVVSPNVDSALAEIHPGIYYVEYAVSNWTTGPFNLKLWGVVSDSGDQTGNGARTAIFTIVTPLSRVMEFDPAVTFDGSLDYFKAWRSG